LAPKRTAWKKWASRPYDATPGAAAICVTMRLQSRSIARYIPAMKGPSAMTVAKIVLGVAAVAATTGVAFAAWMENGAGIVLAMVESGLASCF